VLSIDTKIDDLELCKFEFSQEFADFGSTTAKRMIVRDASLAIKCTFQRCVDYVHIAGHSCARGASNKGGENKLFSN